MPFPLISNDLHPILDALDKQEKLLERIAKAMEELNKRMAEEREQQHHGPYEEGA